MVNVLQSLMAYANAGRIMWNITYPTHTTVPAVLRWRTPENSVDSTNNGILYAPKWEKRLKKITLRKKKEEVEAMRDKNYKTTNIPMKKPTRERKRANTQNVGEKAETKLHRQQRNPQTKRGILRPNLSENVLRTMLPIN